MKFIGFKLLPTVGKARSYAPTSSLRKQMVRLTIEPAAFLF